MRSAACPRGASAGRSRLAAKPRSAATAGLGHRVVEPPTGTHTEREASDSRAPFGCVLGRRRLARPQSAHEPQVPYGASGEPGPHTHAGLIAGRLAHAPSHGAALAQQVRGRGRAVSVRSAAARVAVRAVAKPSRGDAAATTWTVGETRRCGDRVDGSSAEAASSRYRAPRGRDLGLSTRHPAASPPPRNIHVAPAGGQRPAPDRAATTRTRSSSASPNTSTYTVPPRESYPWMILQAACGLVGDRAGRRGAARSGPPSAAARRARRPWSCKSSCSCGSGRPSTCSSRRAAGSSRR